MSGMSMPGGGTMSTAWMRMPGETWAGAAASFLAMWVLMTAAMMLPSLVPMLWRYRRLARATGELRATQLVRLTAVAGAAYLLVWSAVGAAAFPVGAALAAIEMRQPALARLVPIAVGVAVLIGGALQRSAWKARQLACCRAATHFHLAERPTAAAWRQGVRLGVHCVCSCAGPMTIMLGLGLMDLRVMAVVTTAITVERLAPSGVRVARSTGAVAIGAGLFLIVRAVALG